MSLEINLFTNEIDDSVIPKWISEINKLGTTCEIHPEFSFKDHEGFLPFKINIMESPNKELSGGSYLSGFEFYLEDFNLSESLPKPEKKSLFGKLLNKPETPTYLVNEEIDKKLENYSKLITFLWSGENVLELRMALLASATLSKLTNGLCSYPADDIWYKNDTIVEDALNEVREYESSVKPSEFNLHTFEEW